MRYSFFRYTLPCCLAGAAAVLGAGRGAAAEQVVDLTRAVIVTPPDLSGPEKKAVAMLADEVEKRTQLRWRQESAWPAAGGPVVAVGRAAALRGMAGAGGPKFGGAGAEPRPEGFTVRA